MKKQKTAEIRQSKLMLPIFSALCALFASGALIGITLLSSPALQWRLFTALLPEYAVCFAAAFIVVYGYGSILPKIAYLTLPISCLACGVRTVYKSAPYVSPLAVSTVFALLCAAAIVACIRALGKSHAPKKQEKTALSTAFAVLGALAAAAASLALFAFIVNGRLESLQTAGTPIAQIGQMLYYMQHSGQAFTTLVSGVPESYFATQLAPLWYLLLPVYIVFDHSMLAVGVALYALSWIGYEGTAEIQTAGTIFGMKVLCVLVPAIFILGSWAAFKFVWNIPAEARDTIHAEKSAAAAADGTIGKGE